MKGRTRQWLTYEAVRRHRRGESHRAIARVLGIDRRTVRKLLQEAELRREQGDDLLARELGPARAPRPSKLDRYRDFIAETVATHPDIKATRLLEELRARGFDGSYTIVREHLRELRPRPSRVPDKRVTYRPGQQAQADWSEYEIAGGARINAWAMVLSFSRFAHEYFTQDRKQTTIFRQLCAGFEAFGGVPEEVVFDSMPGIVDRWEMDEPILNLRAIDFAAYYGFTLHIAPRGHAKYKGVVERFFRTTEEGLFNGRSFPSREAANALRARWLQAYNQKRHGTTGRPPIELLEREREQLQPLPAHPYDTRELAYRIVDGYGRVRFEGNLYSVPPHYVGRWVYVRADEQCVEIFDNQAHRLASHPRCAPGRRADVCLPEHRSKPKPVSHDLLLSRFAQWGEQALDFARRVRASKRYARPQLVAILELQREYAASDIVSAMAHAARYCAFDAQAVTHILEVTATPRTLRDQLADRVRRRVREAMAHAPIRQRPVEEYARLLGTAASPVPGEEAPHGPQQAAEQPAGGEEWTD